MKEIISQLIDDFQERKLPVVVPRTATFAEVNGKVDVVIGMRRAGKTWFCFQKITELLEKGVKKDKILYLNFEDDRLLEFRVHHFQEILDVYYAKYPENKNNTCYFFFDEIQRINQWEIFIRRLLDSENARIYLTGSSSKLLSTEIATGLRGRALTTEIFPLSFQEFLRFHGLFADPPETFSSKTAAVLRKAATDYFETGGFPEVQYLPAHLRVEILQGYIDTVLLKDIVERHQVSNITAIKYLVRHLITAPSRKFSVNKFYNTLQSMSIKCAKNSLYEFLDHLIDAFVFYRAPIHTRSEKARRLNPVKIYTIDTGLVNAMMFRNSSDLGPLLENMVYMHLRRNNHAVEYVTTRDGHESDFLARNTITKETRLIQVSWKISEKPTFERELRGLKKAMAELSIPSGEIVTWDDEARIDDAITIAPAWKWLLEKIGDSH
jgi:uncharacterized protein